MIQADVILWDWDNTLLDTRSVAKKALQRLGSETGVAITEADVTNVIGGHLVDFWYRNYGSNPIPAVEKFIGYYRYYGSEASLFPLTREVLKWVQEKGIPQIVVSNKEQDIIQGEANRFGIEHYFQRIVGTENHGVAKPEKEFADKALGQKWPEHIVMVGDGESDMAFAQTLGAYGILIGDNSERKLPCDVCLPTLNDVFSFLKENLMECEKG